MRSLVPKLLLAALLVLAALVPVSAASAAPAITGVFLLGTEIETNNKIVAGPDGNMWFTLQGKKVGKVTQAGIVQEFELAGIENTIGIAAGPEGRIWVVATNKATSFLPSNPTGTEEDFTSALINAEPNIVLGPEGLFWVASLNKVAKFSPANFNGTIKEVPLAGTLPNEISPKDIDVAGSEITIADTDLVPPLETSRVVLFNSAGVQRDIAIPGPSQGVAGAPGGQIAYTAAGAVPEQAGLVTPPAPTSAFELLGDPFGVAYGSDQAFWIVQFAKGQLTRLTTTGQTSVLGGLPIESARQIAAGPGNTLWVTLIKKEGLVPVSAIARVSGVELPPPVVTTPGTTTTPPPPKPSIANTKLLKGPPKEVRTKGAKATVKFSFSSTISGSTFQCRLIKPATGKGKKKPKATFVRCRSPKVLHLKPGKYHFAARAVDASGADPSPVERSFTVVRAPRHR
jgi:streptogramin lyase